MSLVNNAWKNNSESYGPYFSSMLVSASDWLKLIFEKVCGFAYIKITLSTNLDMHNRFQGSFCCDLPLQDLNLVSASGGMVTGWNSHQPKIFVFKSSSQKQNCRAHKKDQLCHQDQSSICLPLQELNLVSAGGEMTTGRNSHLRFFLDFKSIISNILDSWFVIKATSPRILLQKNNKDKKKNKKNVLFWLSNRF